MIDNKPSCVFMTGLDISSSIGDVLSISTGYSGYFSRRVLYNRNIKCKYIQDIFDYVVLGK